MAEISEEEILQHSAISLCCHNSSSLSDLSTKAQPTNNKPDIEEEGHSLVQYTEEHIQNMRVRQQFGPIDFDDLVIQPFIHLDLFDEDENDDVSLEAKQFLFEQGPFEETECEICLTEVEMCTRVCCSQMVCDKCMMQYLTQKIQDGLVYFVCPASDCSQPVPRDEIISRVTDETLLEKYHRFVTNANADPNKKTCPSCCAVTTLEDESPAKYGHRIVCEHCTFSWCFECHSPSHENVKCKENIKGLKALLSWSKSLSHGQRNARKCPKCKFLIQRSGGCDHMRCTRCKTHFCYACGGKHLKARFLFGNHYDRLNVFGCPRNFMNGRKKHLRRVVRGTIFSGKLLVGVVGSAVLVGLLPVAAVAALFAGPAIGFVKLHKYLKVKKADKKARLVAEHKANILLSYEGEWPSRAVEPHQHIAEMDLDLMILQRIQAAVSGQSSDNLPALTALSISASPESTSVSSAESLASSYTQSYASYNQRMLIAEKDETTSL